MGSSMLWLSGPHPFEGCPSLRFQHAELAVRHSAAILGQATFRANNCPRPNHDGTEEFTVLARRDALDKKPSPKKATVVKTQSLRQMLSATARHPMLSARRRLQPCGLKR